MKTIAFRNTGTSPRRVRLFWVLGIILLAASAIGAGWVIHSRAGEEAGGGGGSNETPSSGRGESIVICLGHVDVEHGVTFLFPSQPYKVIEVLARENAAVKENDVLVRLDDQYARRDVERAEAVVKNAEGQLALANKLPEERKHKIALQKLALEAAQKKLETAKRVRDYVRRLHKDEIANDKDLALAEGAAAELEVAEKAETEKLRALQDEKLNTDPDKIKQAEADLAEKQATLRKAEAALKQCELKAPEDGTVLRVMVNKEDQFGPQSKQAAVVFCPARPRIIRAEVEQEFANRVRVGQDASIQDNDRGKERWHGKVIRIADWYTPRRSAMPEPFPLADVRTLECIVELDPDQPPLRIGQRVRVTLGR